jgi:hypothetical protein
MPTKFQLLRKEQSRASRAKRRKRVRRLPKEAMQKESTALFYGTLGPASQAKRIDPKTGEVIEIISAPRLSAEKTS